MNSILSILMIVVLGGFFLGLLFYSFYLVLTSKDKKPGSSGTQEMRTNGPKKPAHSA